MISYNEYLQQKGLNSNFLLNNKKDDISKEDALGSIKNIENNNILSNNKHSKNIENYSNYPKIPNYSLINYNVYQKKIKEQHDTNNNKLLNEYNNLPEKNIKSYNEENIYNGNDDIYPSLKDEILSQGNRDDIKLLNKVVKNNQNNLLLNNILYNEITNTNSIPNLINVPNKNKIYNINDIKNKISRTPTNNKISQITTPLNINQNPISIDNSNPIKTTVNGSTPNKNDQEVKKTRNLDLEEYIHKDRTKLLHKNSKNKQNKFSTTSVENQTSQNEIKKSKSMRDLNLHPPQTLKELSNSSSYNPSKKTLILDLDETLVHSTFKRPHNEPDFVLKVQFNNTFHKVYVLKRPFVDEFLQEMSRYYNIVIFTASIYDYADPLLDLLDSKNVICKRFFRDDCGDNYVKDLKIIDLELKDMVIIDNNPLSYCNNAENGIPIQTWNEDKYDNELIRLIPLLKYLSGVDDVRTIIKRVVSGENINFNIVDRIINDVKGDSKNKRCKNRDQELGHKYNYNKEDEDNKDNDSNKKNWTNYSQKTKIVKSKSTKNYFEDFSSIKMKLNDGFKNDKDDENVYDDDENKINEGMEYKEKNKRYNTNLYGAKDDRLSNVKYDPLTYNVGPKDNEGIVSYEASSNNSNYMPLDNPKINYQKKYEEDPNEPKYNFKYGVTTDQNENELNSLDLNYLTNNFSVTDAAIYENNKNNIDLKSPFGLINSNNRIVNDNFLYNNKVPLSQNDFTDKNIFVQNKDNRDRNIPKSKYENSKSQYDQEPQINNSVNYTHFNKDFRNNNYLQNEIISSIQQRDILYNQQGNMSINYNNNRFSSQSNKKELFGGFKNEDTPTAVYCNKLSIVDKENKIVDNRNINNNYATQQKQENDGILYNYNEEENDNRNMMRQSNSSIDLLNKNNNFPSLEMSQNYNGDKINLLHLKENNIKNNNNSNNVNINNQYDNQLHYRASSYREDFKMNNYNIQDNMNMNKMNNLNNTYNGNKINNNMSQRNGYSSYYLDNIEKNNSNNNQSNPIVNSSLNNQNPNMYLSNRESIPNNNVYNYFPKGENKNKDVFYNNINNNIQMNPNHQNNNKIQNNLIEGNNQEFSSNLLCDTISSSQKRKPPSNNYVNNNQCYYPTEHRLSKSKSYSNISNNSFNKINNTASNDYSKKEHFAISNCIDERNYTNNNQVKNNNSRNKKRNNVSDRLFNNYNIYKEIKNKKGTYN